LSGDGDLAADLTQETFVQVWRHADELRNREAGRAWVYRIARNRLVDHRRRAGLDTVALDEAAEVEAAEATAMNPERRLAQRALGEAVRGALRSLGPGLREVVVLHNLEGLSLSQVGEVLGIPIGTVKSRRARAMSALRVLLQAEEVGADEV